MVEGVDEREGRGAIKGSAVVQGGGDADRGLIDVWDAKVDFPHDEKLVSMVVRCGFADYVSEPWSASRPGMARSVVGTGDVSNGRDYTGVDCM